MPTEPIPVILERDLNKKSPGLAQTLHDFSFFLEEITNYGTVIFNNCNQSLTGKSDEFVPLIMSFRHCLELIDSVSILVKFSSIDPCKMHLRSLFETLMGVVYLLEKDEKRRTYAYLVCNVHRKINTYKKLNPSTDQGREFKSKIGKISPNIFEVGEKYDLFKLVQNQEEILKKENYIEAEREYQRLREKKIKRPKWHQFYGGPNDMEKLANYLDRSGEYDLLYRYWSEYIHATDPISGNIQPADEGTYISSLRQPFMAQTFVLFTAKYSLELYELMIKRFVPGNIVHYKIWYIEHIQQRFLALSNQRQIIKKIV